MKLTRHPLRGLSDLLFNIATRLPVSIGKPLAKLSSRFYYTQ